MVYLIQEVFSIKAAQALHSHVHTGHKSGVSHQVKADSRDAVILLVQGGGKLRPGVGHAAAALVQLQPAPAGADLCVNVRVFVLVGVVDLAAGVGAHNGRVPAPAVHVRAPDRPHGGSGLVGLAVV